MQWVSCVPIGRRQMSAKQAKELADKWLDDYLRGRRSELRAADLQRQLELQRLQRERVSRAAIDSRPKTETELVRIPTPIIVPLLNSKLFYSRVYISREICTLVSL